MTLAADIIFTSVVADVVDFYHTSEPLQGAVA